MTNVIAIANQKGGVSKTTTCINRGIGLAQEGEKMLSVDSNPQGSLTISLGKFQPDRLSVMLATVMGKAALNEESIESKTQYYILLKQGCVTALLALPSLTVTYPRKGPRRCASIRWKAQRKIPQKSCIMVSNNTCNELRKVS